MTTSVAPAPGSALARASSADYWGWLSHVSAAAECTHPIRLSGHLDTVDTTTGAVTGTTSTQSMPDGVIYTPCGNRRAAVCPACSAVYRRDTFHLVAAGMVGGKGVPESVAGHPTFFLTLTAPSFGLVHSQRPDEHGKPRVCRPRRRPAVCPHGVDLCCPQTHPDEARALGTPLCLDCYDHDATVVFNAMAGELWRRMMDAVAKQARRAGVRASFAKVAEMQARGVVHFHALIRFDHLTPAPDGTPLPPPAWLEPDWMRALLLEAAAATSFVTPGHLEEPGGWRIGWGRQVDLKTVRAGTVDAITDTAVASYLAKYATKATEAAGHSSARLTPDTVGDYTDEDNHVGRLIESCWRLGRPGAQLDQDAPERIGFRRLRRWAHMLGFGGHFSTKSRRYSTTLGRLRAARTEWRRAEYRARVAALDEDQAGEDTTLLLASLTYVGIGWHTTGDALLANTAAAKAREYAAVGREELATAPLPQPAAAAA